MTKANLPARGEDAFPLMEKAQESLASERQAILILGDSGAGKIDSQQTPRDRTLAVVQ